MIRRSRSRRALVLLLLAAAPAAAQLKPVRLTPDAAARIVSAGAGAGTSGVEGIQSVVLAGDPTRAGLYTIEIRVPAGTRIEAHRHRDDRTGEVVSGRWYLGYGEKASDAAAQMLTAGSFYTEPANAPHFAHTGDEPAVVRLTGYGPTDTVYLKAGRASN